MKASNPIKGSLVITGTRIVASLCGFGLNWLVAQRSAGDLGAFRTLLIFFLVAETLPLLGLQILLVREVALNRAQLKKYVLHGALIAEASSLVMIGGILALGARGGYSPVVSRGLVLIAIALPASAFYVCAAPILVGLGRTTEFGLVQTAETIIRAAAGAVLLWLGSSMLWVIGCFVIARWLVIVVYGRLLSSPDDPAPFEFDWGFMRELLSHAPVFASIAGCVALTRYATPLILPWMSGDEAAGHFGAAFIFIDIVLLLPTALVLNLMPRYAILANQSGQELNKAVRRSVKLMALGVLPVAGGITMIAPALLHMIFRKADFHSSVAILQVVIWSCVPLSVDQVLSAAIVASGKQKIDLQVVAGGAAALLVVLIPLIKMWGALGAAWGFLAGSVALVLLRFLLVTRHLGAIRPLELCWRPLVATGLMMAAVSLLPADQWFVAIIIGALVYFLGLFLAGGFRRTEREEVFGWLGTEEGA